MTKVIFKIFFLTVLYSALWMGIEMIIYGKSNPNIVNDLMLFAMLPLFYKSAVCDEIVNNIEVVYIEDDNNEV